MTNYGCIKLIKYFCDVLIEIHLSHQQDFSVFQFEKEYQYAICMCLIQIGELSAKLTEDFKNCFHEIPWRLMRSFRNHLAHQSGSVDVAMIYTVATDDIPQINRRLTQIITEFEHEHPHAIETLEKKD